MNTSLCTPITWTLCWPRSMLPFGRTRPQWWWLSLPWTLHCAHPLPEPYADPDLCCHLVALGNNDGDLVCHEHFIVHTHYLNQCWPRSMMPYGITRPQWVNSLRPSDAIWWHRSGSTLARVMACCLTAPSHYLNQCWLIISKIQLHSLMAISQEIHQSSMTEIKMKITHLKCQ